MKPRNFPEAKRQRQIGALKRLPHGASQAEREALTMRVGAGSQRHVRTKKDRSATGRLMR